MPRPLRYVPPGHMVEVTNRTIQGRYLLRPSSAFKEIFIGVLAYAQRRHPLEIHAFTCLSNHYHLLLSPTDAHQLADFMELFNTNLSKEAGRLHDWRGPMFPRPYRSIPVSREVVVQTGRLEYVLAQGCKEGLVARPADWPGPNVADALVTGEPVEGIWYDRSAEYEARRSGERFGRYDYAERLSIELDVIPCWSHLAVEEARAQVAEMIARIEADTRDMHRRKGSRPVGWKEVCRKHPHERPKKLSWAPAPLFHVAARVVRSELYGDYLDFVAAFRRAAELLGQGARDVVFPAGSFPPPMPRTSVRSRDGPG